MKPLVTAVVLTYCLGLSAAFGQQVDASPPPDVRPSDESIHQLLEVMQAKELVDAIPQQMDAYFTTFLNKLVEGQALSAEQQREITRKRHQVGDLMKETFTWESMQALYIEVYGKTFSQAEIDSMISFYGSPAGHAVVVKLPLAMQNTMAVMQQRMQALIPKIQQMAKDAAADIKAPPLVSTHP